MARELTARGIDAEYWVIGKDIHQTGYGAQLQKHVAEMGLINHVRFLGHCPNVPDLLRQLDVVVCSSHVEPFGICVIEAMASARPVVATRVGGIPEIVEDGRNGFLVSPKAPWMLADAVEHLLRDPGLRREFGQSGRERVAKHFSQSAYDHKILAIYETLLRVPNGSLTPKDSASKQDAN